MRKKVIVIPCYNEANRFPIEEFKTYIDKYPDYSFVLVNDGSTDTTAEMLNGLKSNRVTVLHLETNVGKAEAVRAGFQFTLSLNSIEIIGYMDADFAAPMYEMIRLSERLEQQKNLQFLFGSRLRRIGAKIYRSLARHLSGRIFSTVASIMLKLPVYDTQCGAKLFRAPLARQVFAEPFLSRWLFDIEIFYRVKRLSKDEFIADLAYEVALEEWIDRGDSRLKLSYLVKVPMELIRIYRHYNA